MLLPQLTQGGAAQRQRLQRQRRLPWWATWENIALQRPLSDCVQDPNALLGPLAAAGDTEAVVRNDVRWVSAEWVCLGATICDGDVAADGNNDYLRVAAAARERKTISL